MSEFDALDNNQNINESPDTEITEEYKPPELELSPEERHDIILSKMKLKNKILRYKELFPHLLQNFEYRIEDLDKMEISELEYIVQELSICVNTRNASGLTKMLYFESMRIVECTGPLVGLQIANLNEALKQNQGIHDILNELSLKYENDVYITPEIRLGYLTATTILSLHKLNSTTNIINDFLTKKIPDDVIKDYEDL